MASVAVADKRRNTAVFEDPPFAKALFGSTAWSWLWLIVRVYVGYTWLKSGLGKLSNPAWVQTGEALKGFWERAAAVPDAPARPLRSTGIAPSSNLCSTAVTTPGSPSS